MQLDGLVLGGGADVDPGLYGSEKQEPAGEARREPSLTRKAFAFVLFPFLLVVRRLFSTRERIRRVDEQRDAFELDLLEHCYTRKKPVLGICRGEQLINIFKGGNLHQDVSNFYRELPRMNSIRPCKQITVEPDSRLARIMGGTGFRVNALNHQAIDRVGAGLRAVAHEAGGIVQAVEDTDGEFLIGVQWHPEYLPHIRAQQHLFGELVREAGKTGKPEEENRPVTA
jgi:putative glutamine amidotransferase